VQTQPADDHEERHSQDGYQQSHAGILDVMGGLASVGSSRVAGHDDLQPRNEQEMVIDLPGDLDRGI
jgi:hypothetical protein